MKTINDFNFKGKRVIMRVDFNVPLNKDFQITDDSRIRAAIPSIEKILGDGGSLVLMSHMGRPKGEVNPDYSLKHIQNRISELINRSVQFAEDCIGESAVKAANDLAEGEVLLLENLRFHKEETNGDISFAESLSKLGDFYVNDAFGTAHRAHASTAIIAKFFTGNKAFGYVMAREIENAEKVVKNPNRPFTAIVGGAKVSDKILIVENLLKVADHIIIGGGMAYTFFKAKGGQIGSSLCEMDRLETCLEILKRAEEAGVQIHLPNDSIIADKFDAQANTQHAPSNEIADEWMGLDIGNSAAEKFAQVIKGSNTVLWNGPMGVFEMEAFSNGTRSVAQAVADATLTGAFTLIGGGDSAAAVYKFGFQDQVSYVSTGGGALLEYFEGKVLPGIKAIIEP
jgi:phosphoglycerate kinase